MADFILRSLAVGYPDGFVLAPHAHRWSQLIFAVSGTMQVEASDMLWLVPPSRALWAPAGTRHAIAMRGAVAMRTIYVPQTRAAALAPQSHAIEVAPLLREVILHIVSLGLLRAEVPAHAHIAEVFLDLVGAAERLPLFVPMPRDARAARVAKALHEDPARGDDVATLARDAGASVRTLQRAFLAETGMRFVEWRQRLRLIEAVTALNAGASVTAAGTAAGYAGTSAFIAAFRAQMGETPARYLRKRYQPEKPRKPNG
jgi:AraC-like DNA-binding protein